MEIWILLISIAILQGFDIATTEIALKKGAVEANKLMAWLMNRVGVIPALVLSKTTLLAMLLVAATYAPSTWLTCVYILIVAGYACVVINNMRHI